MNQSVTITTTDNTNVWYPYGQTIPWDYHPWRVKRACSCCRCCDCCCKTIYIQPQPAVIIRPRAPVRRLSKPKRRRAPVRRHDHE